MMLQRSGANPTVEPHPLLQLQAASERFQALSSDMVNGHARVAGSLYEVMAAIEKCKTRAIPRDDILERVGAVRSLIAQSHSGIVFKRGPTGTPVIGKPWNTSAAPRTSYRLAFLRGRHSATATPPA